MTLKQIKAAVNAGKTVHWASDIYVVERDSIGQWHVRCTVNDHLIGLTWQDGKTMNGRPGQFFVAGKLK